MLKNPNMDMIPYSGPSYLNPQKIALFLQEKGELTLIAIFIDNFNCCLLHNGNAKALFQTFIKKASQQANAPIIEVKSSWQLMLEIYTASKLDQEHQKNPGF